MIRTFSEKLIALSILIMAYALIIHPIINDSVSGRRPSGQLEDPRILIPALIALLLSLGFLARDWTKISGRLRGFLILVVNILLIFYVILMIGKV